jgi:uncharacterized protein YrrD
METEKKFQQNAKVIASNGEEIGHISRVVLRPDTNEVTHIVVRSGSLFKKEEKLVPIEQVEATTEKQIILNSTSEEMEELAPFEEEHFVPAAGTLPGSLPGNQPPSTPLGLPAYMPPAVETFVTRVEQNIPEDTIAIKEGAKVFSKEGKIVGKLERVVANSAGDQATHLLISKGGLSEEKKLVPINWVKSTGDEEIHLGVKEETVDELTDMVDESD